MAAIPLLIVDDNPINLKLAEVLLVDEGYSVKTAEDAEEALKILKTYKPRLILMDIQLPGMNGLELTALLKSKPQTKDVKVIVLTAYAMKGDEEKALASGCDGYVTKPIDTRTLPKTIAEVLKDRKKRKK